MNLNKNQKDDQNAKLSSAPARPATDKQQPSAQTQPQQQQQANGSAPTPQTKEQTTQQRRGIKDSQNFSKESRVGKEGECLEGLL